MRAFFCWLFFSSSICGFDDHILRVLVFVLLKRLLILGVAFNHSLMERASALFSFNVSFLRTPRTFRIKYRLSGLWTSTDVQRRQNIV